MLTLYGKPNCVQCMAVKRWLEKRGIEYIYKDVTLSVEDHREVMDLGYGAVPVVLLPNGTHFYGFDSTKLDEWHASL